MTTTTCPGCEGTGTCYQLEAQLGGDLLTKSQWHRLGKPLTCPCTCPRCKGTGKVPAL